MKRSTGSFYLFILTLIVVAGISWRKEPAQAAEEVSTAKPALLSACFGLDNALPRTIRSAVKNFFLCDFVVKNSLRILHGGGL
jgi:hypothetical protein